jgi:N-acetylglucosamine-6-phosphate deacetylase
MIRETAGVALEERKMEIVHAKVFGADGQFHTDQEIVIRNGRFVSDAGEDDTVLDAEGALAIPGLVDIHLHGARGQDVSDGTTEAFRTIAAYEASVGVTAICPATLTLPAERLTHVLSVGAEEAEKQDPRHADLVGFNMEGPFISPAKKGAQNEAYIKKADPALVERFLAASKGLVRIIGLAPEESPDFESYIRAVKDRVVVSLAHTNADYETAMRAFAAGASHAVHLYNAMTGLSHRAPGVVGAVSDSPWVSAEIICDGIHVHPAAVRAAFRLNGAERMVLISDSLRATGMPDGEYDLGGRPTQKCGRRCTMKDDGSLAGSVTNLADCMRYAVQHMGIPLESAIACASSNPARVIGQNADYGSIENGKRGNVLLLKDADSLSTLRVIKDGVIIA